MPATAQSTSFTLPRGSSVIFELGGIGTATVDPSRISNVYRIGTQEAFLGPYDRSLTIFVSVESGTINYRIDADGDLSDQSPAIAALGAEVDGLDAQRQRKGPLSMDLALAADVPTITDVNSAGWGATAVACDDPRFTYWGGANIAPDTGSFGQIKSKSSSSWVGNQPFFTEFGLDGTSVVIRAGVDAGKQKWMLWVDGKLAQASPDFMSATTGTRDITLTFAAARPRVITILATWGAHKYTVPTTGSMYKVTRSKGRKIALIGDSWGDEAGEFLDGWGYHAALSLGYTDILPSFQGGTGYHATGTAGQGRRSFLGRFADEIGAYGYEDVIVNGSINDLPSALPGVARADVIQSAEAFFDVASRNGQLIVFGCQYIDPTLSASYAALDAELQGALTGRGQFYSSNGWLTGTGRVGTTSGSGNRDIYRKADGNHPTPAGSRYWAARMSALI